MSYFPYHNGLGGFKNNGHTNVHSPDHSNGSVAEPETAMMTLYKKFEHYQQYDLEKNKFMAELFTRLEFLNQQNETLNAERIRNEDFMRSWQLEKPKYDKWYKIVDRAITDNAFVMVLIDGDGMIFNDEFVKYGETGGRQAASQLCTAVQQYIEDACRDIPLNARIVCRMYANVQGLGDVMVRSGIVEHLGVFEDFVRGFSRGKTLFDFVDVGAGKDRADEKIIESFKMFSQDIHCRLLLFGCSHDNGYARSLEEFSDRADIVGKTVLLEGVPFEKELVPLPYRTKKFPGLFRGSKIILGNSYVNPRPTMAAAAPISGPRNYSMLAGLPTRLPAPTRPSGFEDSPLPSRALLAEVTMPRTPSSSTLASDMAAQSKAAMTWASKAAAPPPPTTADTPVYKPFDREEGISRNRAGQRIDPKTKDYDKAEVDRVKKMKLCNVHFLRDECPFGPACSHKHAPKPTEDELLTLRLIARIAPCINGSGCNDIRCIYGHRCPAPPHRIHNVKGTRSCIFAEDCRFPPELHDIDMAVVKTLVIR